MHKLPCAVLLCAVSLLWPAVSFAAATTPWAIRWWTRDNAAEPIEFMRGAAQVVTLELVPANDQSPSDSIELELSVPPGISVIDPSHGRMSLATFNDGKPWPVPFFYFTPQKFHAEALPDGGHRYVMSGFPKYRKGSALNVLSLTFVMSDALQDGVFRYELRDINGHWKTTPVEAGFSAVAKVSVPVAPDRLTASPDVIYLPGASPEEWQALLRFWASIGINRVWYRPRAYYPEVRDRNIQFAKYVARNFPQIQLGFWMPWLVPFSPYNDLSEKFIHSHPEAAGVVSDANDRGKWAKGKLVSNEYLTRYPNDYFDAVLAPNLKLAAEAGIAVVTWDAELLNPWGYSFAPGDLKAFRAFVQLPDTIELTPQLILKQYRRQWLAFRLDQNRRIAQVYARYVRAMVPGAKFAIYSGWADAHTIDRYGIQWADFAPLADFVISGPEGPADRVLKMHQMLHEIHPAAQMLFTIQGARQWDLTFYPSSDLTFAKALAGFGAGGQGYLLWWWGGASGRQWVRIARVNHFAWRFRDLLNQPDEITALQIVKGGAGTFRIRKGDRTLIICSNPTTAAITLNPPIGESTPSPGASLVVDAISLQAADMAVLHQPVRLERGEVKAYCVGSGGWIHSLQP